MTKQQKNNSLNSKSNVYKILVVVIIIAFIILLLSNLLKPKAHINPSHAANNEETYKFKKEGELTFQKKDGNFVSTIDVEFADNEIERATGLMFRKEMNENQGMLFVFPTEEFQSFYMKNTILPLDIIYVNKNLEIVTIFNHTTPFSLESLPSTGPAQYVVEVNAEYTKKHNIVVGDKVLFRKVN
ncbi:MAG: DUF192 domain-containing protein [Ignavibacteriales bacterium]|nr:DUF192 domain-containing protein [Ignavibacteriales bacterium]